MKINDAGLAVIKEFESLRLAAYLPTPDDVWTIGYGHTKGVQRFDTCTPEEAEQWLREDCEDAESCVDKATQGIGITENQYSALVSFTFNVGCTALRRSTLLVKLLDGDDDGAAREFAKWCKQGTKTLNGLVRRRAAEEALFRS